MPTKSRSHWPRIFTSKGEADNIHNKGIWETSPFEPRKVEQTPDASTTPNETWTDDRVKESEERHTTQDLNEAGSTVSSFIRDDIVSDEEFDDEDTLLTLDLERIEHLLSQRLLNGFCLLEKACPACAVPLVKQPLLSDDPMPKSKIGNKKTKDCNDKMTTPKRIEAADGQYHYVSFSKGQCCNSVSERSHGTEASQPSIEVRSVDTFDLSRSSQASVAPIAGVPFCVYCEAHVVTCPEEVQIIQEMASTIDIRRSGQVFVGACQPKRPITNDLLEATRHQTDDNGKLRNIDVDATEGDQEQQQTPVNTFQRSDPTPRKNGLYFSSDGSKSYSLSPKRYNRGKNHAPTLNSVKDDPSCPTRSKSYSPQMKRKGVTEPFFFASYDDASRNGADDNCVQQQQQPDDNWVEQHREENCTGVPSFYEESLHRTKKFDKNGQSMTTVANQDDGTNPEGRTQAVSGEKPDPIVENTKTDPTSPVVVVVATEYSDGENMSTGEGSMGKVIPIVRGTSPVIVKGRKRDPEPSYSSDSVDPIIIITSLEQFTSTEQLTINKTIDTFEQCADPVQTTNKGNAQHQQRRVFTNQQMGFPSVEIPATPIGMNFDDISALAHTYDEGSPTHQFNNVRDVNGIPTVLNRNFTTEDNILTNGLNTETTDKMDFVMPDYETR
jgi:Sjogren's syndrome/scleroderma autoantigen 1 (Autoantigen p27)